LPAFSLPHPSWHPAAQLGIALFIPQTIVFRAGNAQNQPKSAIQARHFTSTLDHSGVSQIPWELSSRDKSPFQAMIG